MPVAWHRRHHQEAIAFLDDALDIAALDMRVADHDVVLLAGVDHALHPLQQLRMLVLPRDAELLAEIAFANQDRADTGDFGQHGVKIFHAAGIFDLQDDENLALRIERPDVGFLIILLLTDPPVARRYGRAVTADADRLVIFRALEPRIAAGADRVGGFLHRRDVREHDAEAADIQCLLGLPLRHLDAVDRDAHHRRHRRNEAGLGDLRPVEHVLQAVAQAA
jgi:hypothetical protein